MKENDKLDSLIHFILSDESPVLPEDEESVRLFDRAITDAKERLEHRCPVCLKHFEPADLCSADIELGTCHAVCLEGSPTVDLETGEPVVGPTPTYHYDEMAQSTVDR